MDSKIGRVFEPEEQIATKLQASKMIREHVVSVAQTYRKVEHFALCHPPLHPHAYTHRNSLNQRNAMGSMLNAEQGSIFAMQLTNIGLGGHFRHTGALR
jgi:hypothetical protein